MFEVGTRKVLIPSKLQHHLKIQKSRKVWAKISLVSQSFTWQLESVFEGSYKKRRKEKYKRVRMTSFAVSKAAKLCKSITRSV